MSQQTKPSLDEVLTKREGSVVSTSRGDAIVKAAKAPPSWNPDERSARFVMSSQAVDRYDDIVVTAGIELDNFMANPKALLFHINRSWPVGNWQDVVKVEAGRPPRLEGTVKFLPPDGPVPEVDQAAWMVENGGISACSIGFIPTDWEMIKDADGHWTGGIEFLKSELVECSLVPIPAHPKALVKSAGANMRLARDLVEDVLDNWKKTPDGLIVPRAEYELAHRNLSGEAKSVIIKKDELEATISETVKRAVAAQFAAANLPEQTAKDVDKGVEEVVCALSVEIDEAEIQKAADQAMTQFGEGLLAGISKMFRATPRAAEPVDPPLVWPTAETCDTAKFLEIPEDKRKEFRAVAEGKGVEAADAAVKAYLDGLAPKPASADEIAAAKAAAAATRERLRSKGLIAA